MFRKLLRPRVTRRFRPPGERYQCQFKMCGDEAFTKDGTFDDLDGSGHAAVGVGDRGIEASGDDVGGYFENSFTGNAWAELAGGSDGVAGYGFSSGGYFESIYPGADGFAYIGYQLGGNEFYGVRAFGRNHGSHAITSVNRAGLLRFSPHRGSRPEAGRRRLPSCR